LGAGLVNCFHDGDRFMVNFLAPGRLGEVARPYLLARREGFSASGAFATILLERVLDLVTVVLFVAFSLLSGTKQFTNQDVVPSLRLGGVLGLGLAVVALASMFLMARSEPSCLIGGLVYCRGARLKRSFVPRHL
jgi:uncharacterized membrane protein YbhN (UPF0104 family)